MEFLAATWLSSAAMDNLVRVPGGLLLQNVSATIK